MSLVSAADPDGGETSPAGNRWGTKGWTVRNGTHVGMAPRAWWSDGTRWHRVSSRWLGGTSQRLLLWVAPEDASG